MGGCQGLVMGWEEEWEEGETVKGQHQGDLCRDGRVLPLDRSGGYMNLHGW